MLVNYNGLKVVFPYSPHIAIKGSYTIGYDPLPKMCLS